jgi:DNA-binding beta-propeller fold protein YncE
MKKVLAVLSLAAAVTACEPAVAPVQPGSGPTSSALQVSNDDKLLVIAAEDHDQVVIVDRESREVLHRVDVGDAPSQVLITKDGKSLVTTRYGGTLHVIDTASG